MAQRSAYALSLVFQPLFIPIYTVMVVLNLPSYLSYAVQGTLRNFLFGILAMNTVVLPMLVFGWMRKKNIITSYHMVERTERHYPFLAGLAFLLSTYVLVARLPLPSIFPTLVIAAIVSLTVTFTVNLWWKVSVHMMGMGGLLGAVLALTVKFQVEALEAIIALIVLAGLVGWARLYLNAHTPRQVYVGFMLGTVINLWVLTHY